jgi:ABC-type antimicrobial peptide transport system permease subunit
VHSIKLGLRSLARNRWKTFFTVISVMLGVSLLVSINVSADSMLFSIKNAFSEQLGKNDILLRDSALSSFDSNVSSQILAETEGIKSFVPRQSGYFTYRLNESTNEGDSSVFIAINSSDPNEKKFGKAQIIEVWPGYNFTHFEDYLSLPGNVCVINQYVAERHNLSVGDVIWVHSQNMSETNQNWAITSTWLNYTVVAVIRDLGESVRDVQPPIQGSWHVRPMDRAIFVPMDRSAYLFNILKQNVSYYFIEVTDLQRIDEIMGRLVQNFNDSPLFEGMEFFAVNMKDMVMQSVNEFASLLRLIFMLCSFLALLVCSILIKNLMEMSTEEQMFEIGVLRAMGSSRSLIFRIFSVQVFTISVIGTFLGLILGIGLSEFFISYLSEFLMRIEEYVPEGYKITVIVSQMPILIGVIGGLSIPVIFGLLPAIRAARVNVLTALDPKKEEYIDESWVRKTKNYILGILTGAFLMYGGYLLSDFGFSIIFRELEIPEYSTLVIAFGGILALMLGFIIIGSTFLPILANGMSYAFSFILNKMRMMSYRNLIRNSKRTKNTLAMLTIGLSFLITVSVLLDSQIAGMYPGAQYEIGGDLRVGTLWGEMNAPSFLKSDFESIEGVKAAIPITMISWGCSIDNYSSGLNPETGRNDFFIYLVDIAAYKQFVAQSQIKTKLIEPQDKSLVSVLEEMENGGKIIVQNGLDRFINKSVGDYATVRFENQLQLQIAAVADMLPGLSSMFWSKPKNGNRFAILASIHDFQATVINGQGDIDLIVQRRFYDPGISNPDAGTMNWWGTLNEWYNSSQLDMILNSIEGINRTSHRISNPASWYRPEFRYQFVPQNLTFKHASLNSTDSEWRARWFTMHAIDPVADKGFGSVKLLRMSEEAMTQNITTIEDLLAFYDAQYPHINATIVCESIVDWFEYEQSWQTQFIQPHYIGEVLTTQFPWLNYTVVGIADVRDTVHYRHNQTVMSYNSNYKLPIVNSWVNTNENLSAYSLYGTRYNDFVITSMKKAQEFWFNSTLNPVAFFTSFSASVHGDMAQTLIKLQNGANATLVKQQILSMSANVTGLENLTIFNVKEYISHNYQMFKTAFLIIFKEGANISTILNGIEKIYQENGHLFSKTYIETASNKINETMSIYLMIQTIFRAILSFSLFISIIGLIISMTTSVKSRSTEIGTLRSMGASKMQINAMIFGETIMISMIALVIGVISGLLCINMMMIHLSFNPFIPMVPSIPMEYIFTIGIGTIAIASIAAIIPAVMTTKIDIIQAITLRE